MFSEFLPQLWRKDEGGIVTLTTLEAAETIINMSNLLYDKGYSSEDFRVAVAMAYAALYIFPQEQWVEEEEE